MKQKAVRRRHNPRIAKFFKWFFILLALAGLFAVATAASLHYWLGSGDFRTRLEAESGEFLGVPVSLSRAHLSFWPQPAVAGTAVLPGVGTGAGAQMGDSLGAGVKKLFGK